MLLNTLSSIRTVADISTLFSTLGYSEEDLAYSGDVLTVARWKAFKVVASEGSCAREVVRALALELARTAERALAVALGQSRELAIAAPRFGQPGITKVMVVSLDSPSGFATEQLERLRPKRTSTALSHALSVVEVLSSEAVGEHFFTEYKIHLERMAASIDRRRSVADRRMVALLCLSRILFLYFVQAKGWLDCRSDYLKHHLDTSLARRRNFYRQVLHPLFFGTLNMPPERRRSTTALGIIPYLNGGLFETHAAERRIGPTHFPNHLWRDVFDNLFERFRFTVREDDEVDAIAPDMLGRVFERLMNVDERHDTGTFYTPEPVVRQVVTATIEAALLVHLPRPVVGKLVAGDIVTGNDARKASRVLAALKVLDPAVGSGAFLLGALHVLSKMRLALAPGLGPVQRLRLRKEILRRNLMGIDLNPVAVHLAELRLWLAVVADDPTSDIASVSPLPNLDGVVRQGDTLLDPLGAARTFSINAALASSEAAESVRTARTSLFDARGREHRSGTKSLRRSELKVARGLITSALESTQHATNDIAESARSPDLFGRRSGLSKSQRERLRSLIRLRRELTKAHRQLSEGVLPFFSFEVHTPDILARGGFDVVMGNPPWVRAEQLPQGFRHALTERFEWWKAGGSRGFSHQPDLSVAFLERCLELTREGGAIGLLLPSKITSAGYGETARRGVVGETSIDYVHRVSDRDAARFGATTYPLAVVLRRDKAPRNHRVRLGFDTKDTVNQESLEAPGPWVLVGSRTRGALEEFRSSGTALGELSPPMLGVKTGADSLFIGRIVGVSDGLAVVAFRDREALLEQHLLRPVLRGRDVRMFHTKPCGVILWCHDNGGVPLRSLPSHAASYFELCASGSRLRSDHRNGPPWEVFRTRCVPPDHRIVWPDIARRPRAVVLEETGAPSAIPLNTCYVAAAPDRETALAVAAVLNSTWAAAFVSSNADEARGGYRRINARVARLLPVPAPGPHRETLAQLSRRNHENEEHDYADLDAAAAYALDLSQRTQDALRSLVDNPR